MSWKLAVERLARLGYICKGVVYVIIGLLAAATIAGRGGLADRQDAFTFILGKPFGSIALAVVAVGLAGYAIWRVLSGVADSERRGSDAKGIAIRAGGVVRGLFYGWIAIEVMRRVLHHGGGGKGSDVQAKQWTARVMDIPFGRWIVAIAGACVIGYCAWQLWSAIQGKLSKKIDARALAPWLLTVSRIGLGARAVIFGVIGGSLISAALRYDPNRARGTSGAMRTLAQQPFGAWLLAITGLGLIAYGVYAFVNARYRRIAAT